MILDSMKIAIPIDEKKGLESHVFEHFGHAPYFLIVDIRYGKIVDWEIKENPYVESHTPGQLPYWLKELGVNVLICQGLGGRARIFFEKLGIKVVTGVSGIAGNIIDAYLKEKLSSRDYMPSSKWNKS